jgi:hypothetical protein
MKRLAVIGDSFSSDHGPGSWLDLLTNTHTIVNYSQRGISEYRLWKNIVENLTDIMCSDVVIVFHTNPDRVWINDGVDFPTRRLSSHHCADLVCADSLDSNDRGWQQIAKNYYKYFHDSQQQRMLYDHLRSSIGGLLHRVPLIEMSGFRVENVVSIHDIWASHPGKINHLDETGNSLVYDIVKNLISI